ncbi:MAG: hypothetical protein Q8N80_04245 [Candidatus Omnitrophota bacterium]|nr:hypothetical protein [Candidatus Omnitrophota bacterium]
MLNLSLSSYYYKSKEQVLFIDELAISLDPIMAKDFKVFIKDKLVREQKKTVIFITHHLNEAEELAERLAIMDKGQIRASGTIGELREMVGDPHATLEEIFIRVTKNEEIKNVPSSTRGFY